MKKAILKAIGLVLSWAILILLPIKLFIVNIFEDLLFNRPLEHRMYDITCSLIIIACWFVYWICVDMILWERKISFYGRKQSNKKRSL